jgi:hypothetical protein
MVDEDMMAVLRSIDRRLALLTGPQERDLRRVLIAKLLKTPARVKMFDAIDGQRGTQELARIGEVGDRAVQLFVKELLDLGLVRPSGGGTSGRGVLVERDENSIVQWYLRTESDER